MNCNETRKISEMLDGELPADELRLLEAHVKICAECQSAREDFLFFRRKIKYLAESSLEKAEPSARRNLWQEIFRRRIRFSLSMPVFASLLLTIVALAALTWIMFSRRSAAEETIAVNASNSSIVRRENSEMKNQTDATSLARFDGGGRAEIYTVQKVSTEAGN